MTVEAQISIKDDLKQIAMMVEKLANTPDEKHRKLLANLLSTRLMLIRARIS